MQITLFCRCQTNFHFLSKVAAQTPIKSPINLSQFCNPSALSPLLKLYPRLAYLADVLISPNTTWRNPKNSRMIILFIPRILACYRKYIYSFICVAASVRVVEAQAMSLNLFEH